VRAVLVGCGGQSKAWVDGLPDGWEIAGFVDLQLAAAERLAGDSGAAVGTDLASMLHEVRPDVVLDCTVPAAHLEVTLTALSAGCHVLGEKPMAENLDDARRMVAAAAAAGRVYAVSQNYRYETGARRLRQMLPELGTLTALHSDFFVAPHFGGLREEMRHVLLLDMAIHTFDAARYMVNGDPKRVFCLEWEPANSWYTQGSSATAVFELDGGKVFTYRGSWCANGFRSSWESGWRIVGTHGSLIWDGFDELKAEAAQPVREDLFDRVEPIAIPALDASDRIGGHLGVIQDFVRAVESGSEPETRGADNIKSLGMVFAAIESAETGRRVDITSQEA